MANMTRVLTSRGGLLGVNALLLVVLAVVTAAPSAQAQRGGQARARGQYTMVSGRVVGGNANTVFVLDAANQEMIGLSWNQTRKGLEGAGYRDLTLDSRATPER